jgi:phosphoenolpyruvate-protein kinase (PTS system EI component)
VLRLLRTIIEAAVRRGRPVMVCGEMAGEPTCAPILIGLGVRELSMNALAIPSIKEVVRSWSLADAEPLAHALCELSSFTEVMARLRQAMPHRHRSEDGESSGRWPTWDGS